jgi:uncharacterized protein (TIGR03435 family)
MKNSIRGAVLGVFAAYAAFGQTAANPPAFEVASIKPAVPQTPGRISVMMGGDPGRVNYTNVTLKNVLMRAYNVKGYQISGPGWLDSERYDIVAKVPDGVPKEQIPAMLQNLLAERFRMAVHRETKEQPVYALVVGKGGPKLKKSEDEPLAPKDDLSSPPPPPPPPPSSGGAGPDGPHLTPGNVPKGAFMISLGGAGGTSRMDFKGATLGAFSDMLSNMLDRPVVDMTELTGNFDITLEAGMDELGGLRRMAPMGAAPVQQHSAASAGPGPGAAATPAPDSAPSASIFTAIQQLGLKLEPRKAPVEYIVIDNAERVPTEN